MVSAANSESSNARDRMLGSVPGAAALGRGPVPDGDFSRHEYHHPAAGWGAARSVAEVLEERGTPVEGVRALFVMNQEHGGFDCPGYMPELNVLCGIADYSTQSGQPVTKRLEVEVTPSRLAGAGQ
jgi:hypothetical protein